MSPRAEGGTVAGFDADAAAWEGACCRVDCGVLVCAAVVPWGIQLFNDTPPPAGELPVCSSNGEKVEAGAEGGGGLTGMAVSVSSVFVLGVAAFTRLDRMASCMDMGCELGASESGFFVPDVEIVCLPPCLKAACFMRSSSSSA